MSTLKIQTALRWPMKQIEFFKLVASGNDFVVIDNRKKVISEPVAFTREVCRPHTGVGADGVLLIEPSKKADFKMRILNADGSEAEACGNGFRCAALLAHEKLGFPKKQRFESLAGIIDADVRRAPTGRVRVRLMDPEDYSGQDKIQVTRVGARRAVPLHYHFIRVGVPHVVIFVEGLSRIPVLEIGREVRYHPRFKPAGANVNFVEITGPQSLSVRTYERGVEQNTLACGTGSTASAIVSALTNQTKPPVRVSTEGGEVLLVDFAVEGGKIQNVYLEGDVKFIFAGVLQTDSLQGMEGVH